MFCAPNAKILTEESEKSESPINPNRSFPRNSSERGNKLLILMHRRRCWSMVFAVLALRGSSTTKLPPITARSAPWACTVELVPMPPCHKIQSAKKELTLPPHLHSLPGQRRGRKGFAQAPDTTAALARWAGPQGRHARWALAGELSWKATRPLR